MPEDRSFIFTKILATVGPACSTVEMLCRLIDEGARVFRLNFSHGTAQDHLNRLEMIRAAAKQMNIWVGVLGDLPGPKIRVGKSVDGGVPLAIGDMVEFQRDQIVASGKDDRGITALSTTYSNLIDDGQPGQRVFIDDGNIRMLVVEKTPHDTLLCNCTQGGLVTSGKGVNLPDTKLRIPSVTDRDRQWVDWAVENALDFLAMSFVRRAGDVQEIKSRVAERVGSGVAAIPVIAKIEKPQALQELADIIEKSDGVMVARGDLGVEMDLTEVPLIQKRIIKLAHDYGKPVIVATQMLQSMIESPVPTRAEVSDVANAIFDGADAVMLSGETAVGKYPVQAVRLMGRIALAIQKHAREGDESLMGEAITSSAAPKILRETRYRTAALAHGVSVVVQDLGAKMVVLWSELGGGARYLSQNRMGVPIITASSSKAALRQMNLLYGVVPILMDRPPDTGAFIALMDTLIQERGWAQAGDPIVVVNGEPLGVPGVTNRLMIHYVGDVTKLRWHPRTEDEWKPI